MLSLLHASTMVLRACVPGLWARTHVCMRVYVTVFAYVYKCVCICVELCTCVHACMCSCVHVYLGVLVLPRDLTTAFVYATLHHRRSKKATIHMKPTSFPAINLQAAAHCLHHPVYKEQQTLCGSDQQLPTTSVCP